MEGQLFEELEKYGRSDFYPLHMPGHKRNICHFRDPFLLDITEIDGFDNLFHAEGILLKAQERAARLYGADDTFYLINGSSCGILAAVSAVVRRGDRILMARNCHKAAYHAALLNGLRVSYIYPSADMHYGMNGSIASEDVRSLLSGQGTDQPVRAVLITSPTYDGVVSDIEKIAKIVHAAGAVLIVDEAHGAHFAMCGYFPHSALEAGADIVVNSLHKTMPAMTQSALLHVKGSRIDRGRLKKYLGIYQSSSPSYVLMAGMDACIGLMEQKKDVLFAQFVRRLEQLRLALRSMQTLYLIEGTEPGLEAYDFDRSKILISTAGSPVNGPELGKMLRENYHLEPEMEAEQYVTAIMTVADTQEGFDRLSDALLAIDRELQQRKPGDDAGTYYGGSGSSWHPNETVLTLAEAEAMRDESILLAESVGRISGEFVYLYPPGIPLLVPGERIPEGFPEQIAQYRRMGLHVQGMQDHRCAQIKVKAEDEVIWENCFI